MPRGPTVRRVCHGVPRIPRNRTTIGFERPNEGTADPSYRGRLRLTVCHLPFTRTRSLGSTPGDVHGQTQVPSGLSGISGRGRSRRSSQHAP